MPYTPGTIFRIYCDNTHYTAVLLKDGKVLEVKNPNTYSQTTYDSINQWCKSHSVSHNSIKADTSKAYGIVIRENTDKNGFRYPTESGTTFDWLRWCFAIISESAPHLLNNGRVRDAYNKAVYVFSNINNDNDNIPDLGPFSGPVNYYSTQKLLWDSANAEQNYPLQHWRYLYGNDLTEYRNVRSEIVKQCKILSDLIRPDVEVHMTKMFGKYSKIRELNALKATVNRYNKKIAKMEATLKDYKKFVKESQTWIKSTETWIKSV